MNPMPAGPKSFTVDLGGKKSPIKKMGANKKRCFREALSSWHALKSRNPKEAFIRPRVSIKWPMAIKSFHHSQSFRELPAPEKLPTHKQYYRRVHDKNQEGIKIEIKKEKHLKAKIELKKNNANIQRERENQKVCSDIIFRRLFVI